MFKHSEGTILQHSKVIPYCVSNLGLQLWSIQSITNNQLWLIVIMHCKGWIFRSSWCFGSFLCLINDQLYFFCVDRLDGVQEMICGDFPESSWECCVHSSLLTSGLADLLLEFDSRTGTLSLLNQHNINGTILPELESMADLLNIVINNMKRCRYLLTAEHAKASTECASLSSKAESRPSISLAPWMQLKCIENVITIRLPWKAPCHLCCHYQ